MAEVRRLSDAVVIGGATLRAERYRPLRAADPDGRRAGGLRAAPVLVLVSGSCDLPWEEPVFTESEMRPVIITSESVPASRRTRGAELCDVITLPGDTVGIKDAIAALRDRGLTRIA